MKVEKVIPSKHWQHISGRRVSLYGSCPWTQESEKKNWSVVNNGWTWQMSNGTIGMGRKAVDTKEEAEEVMERFNTR